MPTPAKRLAMVCLSAASVAVTIGGAQKTFRDSIADAASKLKVGNGLEDGIQMGPVITPQSKERVESLIGLAPQTERPRNGPRGHKRHRPRFSGPVFVRRSNGGEGGIRTLEAG